MSSHHVVRDFQEPALLVADGEMCKLSLLEELLEWSPVVVALDGAFTKLYDLGIKVDYWLGDFDDIDPKETLLNINQDHVEIIETPDQNKTDLEKGIEFLISKGATEINILWADGRRIDHSLSNYSTMSKYGKKAKLVLLNNWSRCYLLQKNFEKWYPKGRIISLIPLPEAHGISTRGLKYNLQNERLKFGERTGSSNETIVDGIISIQHQSGDLFLIEAWD